MTPVYGSEIPEPLLVAFHRACARFADVGWALALQDGEWRILASCGGRTGERRLRECVVNNASLAAVVAHSVEELDQEVGNA